MQKTTFRFEAIVHDDASTDGTADIIREYAERYPEIIKPIFETENQYSKHDGSLNRIVGEKLVGKYVAMCEGDDYWTDESKLQKQVDYMESHSNCSLCFHKVNVLDEQQSGRLFFDHLKEKDYSAREIYDKWTIPTCSVLYRRDKLKYVYSDKVVFGDIYNWLLLSEKGLLHCLDYCGATYRRHAGTLSCSYSEDTCIKLYWQYRYFRKRFPDLADISKRKEEEQGLQGIIHAPYFDGIWKYRVRYMFRHPSLFFSPFFTNTLLHYTKFRHY